MTTAEELVRKKISEFEELEEKYGYDPIPSRINTVVLEHFREILSAIQQDRAELIKWLEEQRPTLTEIDWLKKQFNAKTDAWSELQTGRDAFDAVLKHISNQEQDTTK